MAYRDRRNLRAQWEQQALGQALQAEQRVTLPAPITMNKRDPQDELKPKEAVHLENIRPGKLGVEICKIPILVADVGETDDLPYPAGLVVWDGSGCASSEFWAFVSSPVLGPTIHDVGAIIDAGTTASATWISAPSASGMPPGMSVNFNHTCIWVNGNRSLKWTRASGWGQWSVSVSGGTTANGFIGIGKFKNRLFAWENDSKFWYGSTDEILGTLNPFEIGGVLGGNIYGFDVITNDGGDGPDDYAIFIADNGRVAMFEGTDPGDANAWSHVGTYQIGRPVSPQSKVRYGSQLLIQCEDDTYFLPEDLSGKRQATHIAQKRTRNSANAAHDNAMYFGKENLLLFSDGTCLDPTRGYAFTYLLDHPVGGTNEFTYYANNRRDYPLAAYKGRMFKYNRFNDFSGEHGIVEMLPSNGTIRKARVITAPIRSTGRMNVTMAAPECYTSGTAGSMLWRLAAVADDTGRVSNAAVSDAELNWISASTSTDTNFYWIPTPETGDKINLCLQILSASTSADALWLTGIKITASDTGGI